MALKNMVDSQKILQDQIPSTLEFLLVSNQGGGILQPAFLKEMTQ
jgi:hypothetical protein